MVVDVARQFGFGGTAKHTMTLDELRALVTAGHHPIVFVNLRPIDGIEDVHAVVVVGASQHQIIVLDPLKGERSLPLQAFNTAWAMRHNLAIIVER
jgi:ABC-type bacteriocin/lantibiotic exporter with double-glycine peptidase domain